MTTPGPETVLERMREVAAEHVLPLFRNLPPGSVRDKGGDNPVTDADIASERALTRLLKDLMPGSEVVGEEGIEELGEGVTLRLDDGWVWLVDPLDGTRNFAAGDERFAMMTALLRKGEPVQGVILEPLTGRALAAEQGSGVRLFDGDGAERAVAAPEAVRTGYLPLRRAPWAVRKMVGMLAKRHGLGIDGIGSAGLEYMGVVLEAAGFCVYGNTEPWDHAAGVLMLRELGGEALRFDGSRYRPGSEGFGLVAAVDAELMEEVRGLVEDVRRGMEKLGFSRR